MSGRGQCAALAPGLRRASSRRNRRLFFFGSRLAAQARAIARSR